MAHSPFPEDRPDPNENMPAMRARVPEHVHRGVFSTGAIVMTVLPSSSSISFRTWADLTNRSAHRYSPYGDAAVCGCTGKEHRSLPTTIWAVAYSQHSRPNPHQSATSPEPPPVPNHLARKPSLASDSHLALALSNLPLRSRTRPRQRLVRREKVEVAPLPASLRPSQPPPLQYPRKRPLHLRRVNRPLKRSMMS